MITTTIKTTIMIKKHKNNSYLFHQSTGKNEHVGFHH